MRINNLISNMLLACIGLVVTGSVLAAPTYWVDSKGEVVRDGSGDCVHAIHGTAFPECGETVPPGDSDGDGIADNRDRCPGTPRGTRVDSRGCSLDSDGDGVADSSDRCPGTASGVAVDKNGCARIGDSDGDGVADNRDLCAGTPAGARVNASGCVDKLVVRDLVFATNKAELNDASKAQLSGMVEKIKENRAIRSMTITGHTDDRGAASYNQQLSEQRAQAVRSYFIEQGIRADMIRAVGMGESQPVANNATASGRQQNRRVEIDFQMQ